MKLHKRMYEEQLEESSVAPLKPMELIRYPSYIYVDDIEESTAISFIEKITEFEDSKEEHLVVRVSSYGGCVHSLMSMVDVMQTCPKNIHISVLGKAMSAGAFLAAFGPIGRRYVSSGSRIMIHQISSWFAGKIDELKSTHEEVNNLYNMVCDRLALHCNKEPGYWQELMKGPDLYLTPQQAVEHGMFDYIGVPRIEKTARVV